MKNIQTYGKMPAFTLPSRGLRPLTLAMLLSLLGQAAGAEEWFDAWRNSDQWEVVGDATVASDNPRQLVGKQGQGVLINSATGRAQSLVTKQTFQDVEVHVEFMVPKTSNSGVSFHGNHEIQILDSYGVKEPKAGDCGGIYPRAEGQPGTPSYHHLDAGSPPRVNAAKPPGEWQTMDIIFQAARFDQGGKKTSHAKFVKVVHNGQVIQENVEAPWACGPNWDRKQFPRGPVSLQGDYGPVAFRNVRVRPWEAKSAEAGLGKLNVPPPGFTALFNGKDFTGLRMSPKAKEMWSIEDGTLKAHGLLEHWGADMETEKAYQDFVLMVDFRMPAKSDAGIFFGRLIPDMGDLKSEEFKLRSENGMGILLSFQFMPETVKNSLGLQTKDLPQVKPVNPAIGVWHTVKLTVVGTRLTAELDGDRILDYQYPKGFLAAEPAPIRFQKHRFVEGAKGQRNPCPIEYRNIFIKEIKPSESAPSPGLNVPPPGFTALFNGKDFTNWRTPPLVKQYWTIEDGVLKSHGLLREWGADLQTEKAYRDFVLMLDFRMPTLSDSGIMFRRLIPEIPNFGNQEQFNLRSKSGVGELESYYFLPHGIARNRKLREEDEPHIRTIDPEIGVWHTVKLTMRGRSLSAEYDGEVLYDRFTYPGWMMSLEPAPIRLQKHVFFDDDILGKMNPCPIEYRNILIKELDPGADVPSQSRVGADPGSEMPLAPGLKPVNRWKWLAPADGKGENRKEVPVTIPDGRTIHITSFGVSENDNKPPVVLLPGSRLRARGRAATAHPVFLGVTIHHPNGDFAGRFQTICPADEFQGGKDFELTRELRDLQLDPSLADQKDKLPGAPDDFVVESIWLHTLDKRAGMEIDEVELIPPGEGGGTGRTTMMPVSKPEKELKETSSIAEPISRIDAQSLPAGYDPQKHQEYVDRRMAGMSEAQKARISQLWKEKQRIDPAMKNRGASFVKIMESVAGSVK